MSTLEHKVRLVAVGFMFNLLSSVMYSSIVSCESVRIAFLLASLNNLEVLSADISGAFLNVPCAEWVAIVCGLEFREFQGWYVIIVCSLYGIWSTSSSWRNLLASTLTEMGFESCCLADPDVWCHPAETADGFHYYKYILVYVDDILNILKNPREVLEKLGMIYQLKNDEIKPLKLYLGLMISKFLTLSTMTECWAMGSQEYVKEAIQNVEKYLKQYKLELKKKVSGPLPLNY